MFDCFKGYVGWDDFYSYFSGACYKYSDTEVAVLGDPLSIVDVSKNLFGVRPRTIRLERTEIRRVLENPGLFNFPKLGYFPVTPSGLIAYAYIHPTDQLRRGFNPTRVSLDYDPHSLSFQRSSGKAAPTLTHAGAFGALMNMSTDVPRFTPFDEGMEKMWSGETFGFVTNPKTCVVLNAGVDNEDYPALVLHNGAEIGRITANKNVVAFSPKVDVNCMLKKVA